MIKNPEFKEKIKENVKSKFGDLQKTLDEKYNHGVESNKRNPVTAEASVIAEELYKRKPDELHSGKDSLFRKTRKVFINGIVFITPFFIGLPIKMTDEAIQRNVDLKNANSYHKIYVRELVWVNAEIRSEKAKGHDTEKLVQYRSNLEKSKAKMGKYIETLEKKEDNYEKTVKEGFIVMDDSFSFFEMPTFEQSELNEDEYDNILLESFEVHLESVRDKVRSVVHSAKDVAKKATSVKVDVDKASEPMDNAVNDTISNIKKTIREDKNEEITLGENRFKLTRIIRKCITYGALVLVHPALAAIVFLASLAHDAHIDHKERSKIVNDLETELKMVKEKIKDAESKGDNENKYKLMRIEDKLSKEISRIKFREDHD